MQYVMMKDMRASGLEPAADPHLLVAVYLTGGPLDGEEVRLPLGIVLPSGCSNWKRKEAPSGQQP